MACFVVPAGEAVVTTIVKRRLEKAEAQQGGHPTKEGLPSLSRKLSWLNTMLWGGSGLLALEHVWHGEVIFTPPFLTAMSNAEDTVEMLHEMSTVGVGMAVLVTCVWALGCLAIDHAAGMRKALLGETA